MKKIIGVTPRSLTEGTVQKQFVNYSYVDAMINCGFNVIMLTLNNPKPIEVLDLCDAFLITGGSDIDPINFGEKNEGLSEEVNHDLDELDKLVVEYAVKTKKPLLGICRGHQSINVFLGGSLHQDIGTSHKNIKYDHKVKTFKNDFLDFDENIITNSYHHQAVNAVAPNLQVVARHEDGTVEAFVHKDLPIIGIQWHPEKLPDDKVSKTIFAKFTEFVNKQ